MKERIRKPLLIVLAVLLVLVIAAGVIWLLYPQIPAYFRIKKENPVINDRMEDFPYTNETVPADFVSRMVEGITVKGPEDCLNPVESRIVPFKSDRLKVLIIGPTDSASDFGIGEEDLFTAEEYQHFFDTIGVKKPETQIENIVFLRDTLNAKSCLRLRGKDMEIFEFLAENKNITANVETPYYYRGDNFSGIICKLNNKKQTFNVMIEDAANGTYYTVTVVADSTQLAAQVIAGLEFPAAN